jgi:hypothetical protein
MRKDLYLIRVNINRSKLINEKRKEDPKEKTPFDIQPLKVLTLIRSF